MLFIVWYSNLFFWYLMRKYLKNFTKVPSFTLVELIFVVMIISLIVPSMFALYNFIVKANREISARQSTIQQWYEFFERLNVLMQDYTIDYEEYYNRQMVWCTEDWDVGADFKWEISTWGYCTEFTAYGNENSVWKVDATYHNVYYCSSIWSVDTNCNDSYTTRDDTIPKVYKINNCWKVAGKQSYGQYAALFKNVKWDTDSNSDMIWKHNCVWDADDENLWKPFNSSINAIMDADHIQELYFISHDWKSRLFFRRKLVNIDDNSAHYKIQMLRLRWFDAWEMHNFSVITGNVWLYDWVIDTWACDYWMWFVGNWTDIWWVVYSGYKLPADVDDCWIDLTRWSTSVTAWNIVISPTTDSDLAWSEPDRQINAYMKILTVNWVYAPYYVGKVSDSIRDFKVPLETTINMKDFYRN